ncbi:fMet-Leu-Phe receptor [Biomphalaria pfeifferi]|uniref:fMet-Leu-Phe receptor n=1 Tax=Biomphalaria pfeifferi TaxID=112525 RepID=A0AAD8BF03_BIOPF|nr:fMet-Leu-Phe receptor [Biomphalaria pfeifferi]
MFTTFRSILVISFVTIISVGSYIPLLKTMTLSSLFDPLVNSTRLIFWVSPGRKQVRIITGIVRNTSLPLSCQVMIVCCVLYMSKKLQTSVNFRLGLQSFSPFSKASVLTIRSQSNSFASEQVSDETKEKSLSGKEQGAIQQMVFMSIAVIICDMPEILISLISVLVQTFGFRKPLNNFYLAVIGVNYMFQVINTSINFAIYWKYSTVLPSVREISKRGHSAVASSAFGMGLTKLECGFQAPDHDEHRDADDDLGDKRQHCITIYPNDVDDQLSFWRHPQGNSCGVDEGAVLRGHVHVDQYWDIAYYREDSEGDEKIDGQFDPEHVFKRNRLSHTEAPRHRQICCGQIRKYVWHSRDMARINVHAIGLNGEPEAVFGGGLEHHAEEGSSHAKSGNVIGEVRDGEC